MYREIVVHEQRKGVRGASGPLAVGSLNWGMWWGEKGDSETSADSETRFGNQIRKLDSETRGQIPKPRFGNPDSETRFGNWHLVASETSNGRLRKLGWVDSETGTWIRKLGIGGFGNYVLVSETQAGGFGN